MAETFNVFQHFFKNVNESIAQLDPSAWACTSEANEDSVFLKFKAVTCENAAGDGESASKACWPDKLWPNVVESTCAEQDLIGKQLQGYSFESCRNEPESQLTICLKVLEDVGDGWMQMLLNAFTGVGVPVAVIALSAFAITSALSNSKFRREGNQRFAIDCHLIVAWMLCNLKMLLNSTLMSGVREYMYTQLEGSTLCWIVRVVEYVTDKSMLVWLTLSCIHLGQQLRGKIFRVGEIPLMHCLGGHVFFIILLAQYFGLCLILNPNADCLQSYRTHDWIYDVAQFVLILLNVMIQVAAIPVMMRQPWDSPCRSTRRQQSIRLAVKAAIVLLPSIATQNMIFGVRLSGWQHDYVPPILNFLESTCGIAYSLGYNFFILLIGYSLLKDNRRLGFYVRVGDDDYAELEMDRRGSGGSREPGGEPSVRFRKAIPFQAHRRGDDSGPIDDNP